MRRVLHSFALGYGLRRPSFRFLYFRKRFAKRFAAWLQSGLVRPSIGQALANDAFASFAARSIVNAERSAVVVAEIKLRKIAVQMLLGAMLIHAAHAALEH